jgi:PAS domain S-box-containing protein
VSTNICLALLPVLGSVYTNRFAVLAWIVLKNSVLHGLSTASAQGFILWSFATLPYRKGHRFHARLTRLARFCATRSEAHGVSRAGRLLVRSYLEIALDYWGSSIRRTNAKLRSFQREATALGAFEVDAQARTLYCQNLLYAGVPLAEVKRTFRNERRHVEAIGHSRVAASMKKYHQAVECLQGSCPDPLELTGSVTNEAEVLRGLEESRDRLGLEGFYSLKTMVALYNAQPSAALAACREWPPTPTTAKWIMSSLINEYHRALAAWQCGAVREARAATAVLAEIHGARLGRHRLPAARAERSRFLGRLRAARRAYRSAVDRALADGFPHEAAYLCERLADLPGARVNIGSRTRAEKERMLSTAYMLYSEWGARPAVERVRRKLADLRTARGAPADRAGAAAATVEPGQLVAEDGGADRRLSRMQHNLRLLVTSINDALLLLDYDGRLLFCNPAAEQYLAETDDTGVNGAAGEEALQPEIAEVVQELVSQPLQVGQVLTRDCSWRGRVLRVVLSPGMGAEGAPVAAATIADITESRQREQQLAVADRMASIGLLTATVAHEVANPNHVVQLNLQSMELLLDRGLEIAPSDSSVADTLYELRSALAGVRDGSRRIDDVVSLVKSHGRAADEDTPQSGSPAEVADHVARFTRFLTRANQVEFRLEVEDRLPNIELYGSTLEQALINLVKNACEATTGDRRIVVLRVRAATIEDGTAVRFEVCDTGSGIPEALARAVATDSLTPYAKTSTKAGGTGLGLSIVQSIVRRHRGLFSYRSEPDFSTVAEIVVPAAR